MWLSNFENGTSISSKNVFWTQLKERSNGAKMTGLQLTSSLFPNLFLELSDLDRYYFVTEASAFIAEGVFRNEVLAEIIGGHNLELGIGIEIRLEYTGSAKSRIYKLERYKYSKDILVEGTRRH